MNSLQHSLASDLPGGEIQRGQEHVAKREKDDRAKHVESVSQAKWCMVKATLPEPQTNGRWVRGYLLWLTGTLSEIVGLRLSPCVLRLRTIVRFTHQCYVIANGRKGRLTTTQLIYYVMQGYLSGNVTYCGYWNFKVSEYLIWCQSFHITQRLPVMGLAWGRKAG